MTIGQLSKAASLSAQTIRFYETQGLITSIRLENNYRSYSEDTVQTLDLISNARSLDLSLSEIKVLLAGCIDASCHDTKKYVYNIITQNITQTTNKIKQLNALLQRLNSLAQNMEDDKNSCNYCCHALNQLKNQKGGESCE